MVKVLEERGADYGKISFSSTLSQLSHFAERNSSDLRKFKVRKNEIPLKPKKPELLFWLNKKKQEVKLKRVRMMGLVEGMLGVGICWIKGRMRMLCFRKLSREECGSW